VINKASIANTAWENLCDVWGMNKKGAVVRVAGFVPLLALIFRAVTSPGVCRVTLKVENLPPK